VEQDIKNLETKRFMSLLVPHQKKIYAFIRYLVPRRTDADDILQETLTEMWNKFDEYREGTNFVSWGLTIARYKIMSFTNKKRPFSLQFSDKTLGLIQDEAQSTCPHKTIMERIEILKECMTKLSDKEKKLLRLRYEQDLTFEHIARQFRLSIPAIYKALSRIHASLAKCVRLTLRLREVL
jgi:RNA polymerase sigma-70 factor (ECF subfamily)